MKVIHDNDTNYSDEYNYINDDDGELQALLSTISSP